MRTPENTSGRPLLSSHERKETFVIDILMTSRFSEIKRWKTQKLRSGHSFAKVMNIEKTIFQIIQSFKRSSRCRINSPKYLFLSTNIDMAKSIPLPRNVVCWIYRDKAQLQMKETS